MLRQSIYQACKKSLRTGVRTNARKALSCARSGPVTQVNQHLVNAFSTESSAAAGGEKHEFQAETKQLLDIVTHSIYTDKDVFVRELISNSSDALEKLRHMQAVGESIIDPEVLPEIHITTDEENNTLTISDSGIGMSKAELVENLGTIARSGSKKFLEQLKEKPTAETAAQTGIIGKFGVGFYSAFMVGDKVEVFSRSATNGDESNMWKSDGSGSFEIANADGLSRGSKIVIHLKDSCKEYAKPSRIESIVKQYSNFVSFPIILNGEAVNTVKALWTLGESEVSEEEYSEFYKFISNSFDDPMYRLQFRADAPIELKCLFFVGSTHTEKFGYARLQPGVSLYSRKVLIERNSPDILPDWLRFVRGVVDSEDLPLSLSRETMQDTRMLAKIKDVITRRLIRFFDEKSRKDPEGFQKFFDEFGSFIKEGICMDFQHKDALAKLLRYDSSTMEESKLTTLDEYIARCAPDQEEIYYLHAPSKELAQASPYYEAFKKTGKEVLFVYNPVDEFVMTNLAEYSGRKVVSAERAKLDVEEGSKSDLSEAELDNLTSWIQNKLHDKVKTVEATSRLVASPAVITEHESASVRRMMAMVNSQNGLNQPAASKHKLEVNSAHSIITGLHALRETNEELAEKILNQVHDNACLSAGLIDDGREMIPRLNELLEELIKKNN